MLLLQCPRGLWYWVSAVEECEDQISLPAIGEYLPICWCLGCPKSLQEIGVGRVWHAVKVDVGWWLVYSLLFSLRLLCRLETNPLVGREALVFYQFGAFCKYFLQWASCCFVFVETSPFFFAFGDTHDFPSKSLPVPHCSSIGLLAGCGAAHFSLTSSWCWQPLVSLCALGWVWAVLL